MPSIAELPEQTLALISELRARRLDVNAIAAELNRRNPADAAITGERVRRIIHRLAAEPAHAHLAAVDLRRRPADPVADPDMVARYRATNDVDGLIVTLYAEHFNPRQILNTLNAHHFPTRRGGERWEQQSVRHRLIALDLLAPNVRLPQTTLDALLKLRSIQPPFTLQRIAAELNRNRIPAARGDAWDINSVWRTLRALRCQPEYAELAAVVAYRAPIRNADKRTVNRVQKLAAKASSIVNLAETLNKRRVPTSNGQAAWNLPSTRAFLAVHQIERPDERKARIVRDLFEQTGGDIGETLQRARLLGLRNRDGTQLSRAALRHLLIKIGLLQSHPAGRYDPQVLVLVEAAWNAHKSDDETVAALNASPHARPSGKPWTRASINRLRNHYGWHHAYRLDKNVRRRMFTLSRTHRYSEVARQLNDAGLLPPSAPQWDSKLVGVHVRRLRCDLGAAMPSRRAA